MGGAVLRRGEHTSGAGVAVHPSPYGREGRAGTVRTERQGLPAARDRRRAGRLVDDLFLTKFMGEHYNGYDVVIAGFAQHPASKEHWTVDRYRGAVFAKAKRVRELLDLGAKVIWYGAPQYPHTTNGYPVVVRDWRTDARLQLFNEASFAAMTALGVPVVDSFAVTTPMSHTSP